MKYLAGLCARVVLAKQYKGCKEFPGWYVLNKLGLGPKRSSCRHQDVFIVILWPTEANKRRWVCLFQLRYLDFFLESLYESFVVLCNRKTHWIRHWSQNVICLKGTLCNVIFQYLFGMKISKRINWSESFIKIKTWRHSFTSKY